MADQLPQWETSNNQGTTSAYSGTATTSVTLVPASAGAIISDIVFYADDNNLEISLDNGATFFSFGRREIIAKNVKGEITQVQVKTSSGSKDWRMWIDFEE